MIDVSPFGFLRSRFLRCPSPHSAFGFRCGCETQRQNNNKKDVEGEKKKKEPLVRQSAARSFHSPERARVCVGGLGGRKEGWGAKEETKTAHETEANSLREREKAGNEGAAGVAKLAHRPRKQKYTQKERGLGTRRAARSATGEYLAASSRTFARVSLVFSFFCFPFLLLFVCVASPDRAPKKIVKGESD